MGLKIIKPIKVRSCLTGFILFFAIAPVTAYARGNVANSPKPYNKVGIDLGLYYLSEGRSAPSQRSTSIASNLAAKLSMNFRLRFSRTLFLTLGGEGRVGLFTPPTGIQMSTQTLSEYAGLLGLHFQTGVSHFTLEAIYGQEIILYTPSASQINIVTGVVPGLRLSYDYVLLNGISHDIFLGVSGAYYLGQLSGSGSLSITGGYEVGARLGISILPSGAPLVFDAQFILQSLSSTGGTQLDSTLSAGLKLVFDIVPGTSSGYRVILMR